MNEVVEKKWCFTLAFPYFPVGYQSGSNACGSGSAAIAARGQVAGDFQKSQ